MSKVLQKPGTIPQELKFKYVMVDMKVTLLHYPDTPIIELQITRSVFTTIFYDPVNL